MGSLFFNRNIIRTIYFQFLHTYILLELSIWPWICRARGDVEWFPVCCPECWSFGWRTRSSIERMSWLHTWKQGKNCFENIIKLNSSWIFNVISLISLSNLVLFILDFYYGCYLNLSRGEDIEMFLHIHSNSLI